MCPVSREVICRVPTEDMRPVSTGVISSVARADIVLSQHVRSLRYWLESTILQSSKLVQRRLSGDLRQGLNLEILKNRDCRHFENWSLPIFKMS